MRETASGMWLTPITPTPPSPLSPGFPPSSSLYPLGYTGSVRDENVVRRIQPSNALAKCPNEVLVAIAEHVEDLRIFGSINRRFEDIASYVDFERTRRYLPTLREDSAFVSFPVDSFHTALWSWKHTGRIPLNPKQEMTYFISLSLDKKMAKAQVKSLLGFLSTPFTTCPFSSITILNADVMSLTDIVDFLYYCDNIGCREVEIETSEFSAWRDHEFKQVSTMLTRTSLPPLKNLRDLKLHHPHFTSKEWSFLFRHIKAPHLQSLDIRGRPAFGNFVTFLSYHTSISTLRFHSPKSSRAFRPLCRKLCLPALNEIRGPVANVTAILSHLDSHPDIIMVDIEPLTGETWSSYVSGICKSLKHIDSLVDLKLRISKDWADASMKSKLNNEQIHNVLSLDISFPSSIDQSTIPVSFSTCDH